MIVMVRQGRLGNQLFQYLALRTIASPRERLVLLGFTALDTVLEGVDAAIVPIDHNPLRHAQSIDYSVWSRRLRAVPGVGTIAEDGVGTAIRPSRHRIEFVEPAWFQSHQCLTSPALTKLHVRPTHLAAAQAAAHRAGINLTTSAFIHVRAGDYRAWPSPSAPAILSPDWYRRCAEEIRRSRPEISLVAIGDEPDYTAEVVAGIDDVVLLREAEAVEFAAMTLCPAGIVSASSFGYWGAYFAHRAHGGGTYLAPEFWAGHASKSWYPPALRGGFLTYRR